MYLEFIVITKRESTKVLLKLKAIKLEPISCPLCEAINFMACKVFLYWRFRVSHGFFRVLRMMVQYLGLVKN